MGAARHLSYALARQALFALDPEVAHALTLGALDRFTSSARLGPWVSGLIAGTRVSDPVEILGLRFANRVGLAAGLDKNARHIDGLAALGFGFIELGTVTPLAQAGSPKPRLFRLRRSEALINRFGFNNDGLDTFAASVKGSRTWLSMSASDPSDGGVVLGLNIGKNAATPIEHAIDDYLLGMRRLWHLADYIVINISSPNTANLRRLQASRELTGLLSAVDTERARLASLDRRTVPLLLKVAPDLDDEQIEVISRALPRHSMDGVIATNTSLAREALAPEPHASEAGGLSGRPVFLPSNRVVRSLRQSLPSRFPIIGVGGISSAADAVQKIDCGADLVQLYTGLIYRGPGLIGECAEAIRQSSGGAVRQAPIAVL